MEVKSIR